MARRTGKTTRKIDESVQRLFNEGQIVLAKRNYLNKITESIKDEDATENNLAQTEMIQRLFRRLKSEHENCYEVKEFDRYFLIKLK